MGMIINFNLDQTLVNLYDVCNRLGIKKVDIEFKKYDDNDIKIFVNEKDGYERQRFTIAHEIGHLDGGNTNQFMYLERRDGYKTDRPEERQANQFAAALFIDRKIIEEKFNNFFPLDYDKNKSDTQRSLLLDKKSNNE